LEKISREAAGLWSKKLRRNDQMKTKSPVTDNMKASSSIETVFTMIQAWLMWSCQAARRHLDASQIKRAWTQKICDCL